MRHYLYRSAPFLVALVLASLVGFEGPPWP